ncbi:wax ester/triacylglycerol synthase family O-acyltransferase [Nitriliruptoraceae bacterium ZYF776]|nr:wax ester/triacylglycerol synthase family O-acyltransferase [Profundirhabdus halotolerans]
MRPMPITDAMFLLAEVREKPMHVGGLQLWDPPEDAGPHFAGNLYREVIEARDVAPLFQRRARKSLGGLGPWEWTVDEDLELEHHVRHGALPHPGRIRELLALVSRLHSTLLDRNRPLWEMNLIEGLHDGRFASYSKVHHALLDGVSAMRWFGRATSTDPDERDMPAPFGLRGARRPKPSRSTAERLGDLGRGVVGGGRAAGEVTVTAARAILKAVDDQAAALPFQAPRTMLNVPIAGARRFAGQSWPLERITAVKTATGASVNDVVLAMSAGALRRYLLDQDALPAEPLVAAVPVSLRDAGDTDTGNAVGAVLCNLGTHLEDPVDRLELIHRSMQDTKAQLAGLSPLGILALSALAFGGIALGPLFRYPVLRQPAFNLVISNVPGPAEPRYWNGARLDGMYPVSIPYDGQALNLTVTSYAGNVAFGITGCRRSVPHLQRLLDHLEASLTELEDAVG